MSGDAWIVACTIVATLIVLATNRVGTVVAMGGALVVLLVTGAATDEVVLSGLSSPATATIGALYVVAGAVATTGALAWMLDRLLFGRVKNDKNDDDHGTAASRHGIARLGASTAAMSSFVPNTPLVALAAPRVVRWSRRTGVSASRLLMPLSFASILGGVITLLGTSTNLVVSDVLSSSGGDALDIFEITPIGLPVAIVGLAVMIVTAPRLLRDRTAAGEALRATARQFEIQMLIDADGPLIGLSIEAAGLRELDGVFLAAVERRGRVVPAAADDLLDADDRLYFVGDVARIVDLQDVAGLTSAEQAHLLDTEGPGVRLYEAVVAGRSELSGRTLKSAGFRARYGAAVLAAHRSDGDLRGKLGTIPLNTGDVLLVLAGPDFAHRWREYGDFSLVASVDDPPPPRRNRAWVAAVALAGLVILSATGVVSLFAASVIAAGAVIVGGALSLTEARHAVDLSVVLTIALSISLGNAVASSGLAAEIADALVRAGEPLGTAGLLAVTIVATQLLTEVLSNSGAAAIMVPIAMSAAVGVGGDPRAFAIGVLIGASCSFLTPVGYQTNLMVYGLGGYRFTDFTRVGLPLTVVSAVVATVMLELLY